ncbi:hypothetical protein EJB05_16024, partial [Eragrostis curvula]
MDDPSTNAISQGSSSDMSISTEDEGNEQNKKASIEFSEEIGAVEDPVLGMTFDNEDVVWNYYTNYAKSKGCGVTTRSSRARDDGELKYVTLSCSRQGAQSKSKNMLKPNPLAGTECKAKINVVRWSDAGGHENLTFGEKDCRNFLDKTRSIMDLDDESRLRNTAKTWSGLKLSTNVLTSYNQRK